ncbi:MAG: DUF2141 domain-containing protein [Schleiferiaceae bacterium]|jgi:uncharacterized protein (DUF2141 family)|nr:DUF2141 domain-containing protein [Schleiferiaceae bacterium]
MKIKKILLIFACCASTLVAQEKPGLYFTCAAADQYPARIAYEILDANEQRLAVGFAEIQSAADTAYVEVQLPERFMVQVYEDANRNDKLDRGLFTQPLERYDFSNEAWVFLGKPDLEDALVQRQGPAHYLHFQLKDVLD